MPRAKALGIVSVILLTLPFFAAVLFRVGSIYAVQANNERLKAYNRGDMDTALEKFQLGTRLDPVLAVSYSNRAEARSHQGDLPKALNDENTAIWLDASNAIFFNDRGEIRCDRGDVAGAIADTTNPSASMPAMARPLTTAARPGRAR